MKSTIRNLISFAFACVVVVLFSTSVHAADTSSESSDFGHKIVVKDYFGNEDILAHSDVGSLDSMPISTFSYTADDSLPPAPYIVGRQIDDLKQAIYDLQVPRGASFAYIDYGPNWENVVWDEESDVHLSGRYVYVFYGLYNSDLNRPATHAYSYCTGHDSYSWVQSDDPKDNVLTFGGPFAMLCWNIDDNGIYQQANSYDESFIIGGCSELIFEGIVSANDPVNSSFYPKLITFSDVDMTYFDCGPYDLTLNMDYFAWNNAWDGTIQHPDNEDTRDFWDLILDGSFTVSDNPLIQFFASSMVNLAKVVDLLRQLPDKFSNFVSFLPPVFSEFLIICFGLILTAFLIKFCIRLLKR